MTDEPRNIIGRLSRLSQAEHQAQIDLERLAERQSLEESLDDARESLAEQRRDYNEDAAKAERRGDDPPSWRKDAGRRSVTKQIRSLQHDIAGVRLSQGATKRNILQRMRRSEQRYNELYRTLTRRDKTVGVGNLYHPQTNRNKASLDIRVEISLDGKYFSNPAPTIEPFSTIWVRAVITDTTASDSAMEALPHELLHVKWRIPRGYTKLDPLYKWGHDVFFVSNPVVITRKFEAPEENTARNWMVIARIMHPKGEEDDD